MFLSSMSHVEFKKCPCRPVDFRGQGPPDKSPRGPLLSWLVLMTPLVMTLTPDLLTLAGIYSSLSMMEGVACMAGVKPMINLGFR